MGAAVGPFHFRALLHQGRLGVRLALELAALIAFAGILRPAHHVIAPAFDRLIRDHNVGIRLGVGHTGADQRIVALVEGGDQGIAKLRANLVSGGAGFGLELAFIEQIFAKESQVLANIRRHTPVERSQHPRGSIGRLLGEHGERG